MAQLALGPLTRIADTLCELSVSETFPAEAVERVRLLLDVFAATAALGMYSGGTSDGLDSSFDRLAPAAPGARERMIWRYLAHAVDPGAFRVLGNLLNHHVPRPSNGLMLELRTVAHQIAAPAPWESLQRFAYPCAPTAPFSFEDALAEPPGKEVVVRIEFSAALPDDAFDKLKVVLDAWERVAALGGFADLFDVAGPIASPGGDQYLVTPSQVEYVLNGLDVPLAAFDALLAGLVRVHWTVQQIAQVEFES